uniref:Uncharacterized protein n=1 Tax=Arundo donax TaxID=35708 RepID=A0A0A8Y1Y6_ARUDO
MASYPGNNQSGQPRQEQNSLKVNQVKIVICLPVFGTLSTG